MSVPDVLGVLLALLWIYVAGVALREAWYGRLLSWRALAFPLNEKEKS